jgi:hypothetical protein
VAVFGGGWALNGWFDPRAILVFILKG